MSKFKKMIPKSLMTIILLVSFSAHAAEDIEVPEDELAKESVLPVFDNVISVKNRNVTTEGRIDFGLYAGLALTEPIANTTKVGLELNYHFNENHSLGLNFAANSTGLSKDAQGLKEQFGLDYSRAPKPLSTIMLDYNYSPFYGKMSVTKDGVMNTTIYGSGGIGMIRYEHKSYPAISLGLGERFYFTNSLCLKVDFKIYANQAPIPFKANALHDGTGPDLQTDPVPTLDSFDERLTYTSNLQIGLNYLF